MSRFLLPPFQRSGKNLTQDSSLFNNELYESVVEQMVISYYNWQPLKMTPCDFL